MNIYIEHSISTKLPNFNVTGLKMDVVILESSHIEDLIRKYEREIAEKYSLKEVLEISEIKVARDGYKTLGKDPSRYRLACESLLRRLVKGNQLYRINSVVDIGNLLSIELKRSIALLDYSKIKGDVRIRKGLETDIYEGIGRGIINVNNIPLYCDEIGPFGSPTSDTMRTALTKESKTILLMIISFSNKNLDKAKNKAIEMFKKYAYAENIEEMKTFEL